MKRFKKLTEELFTEGGEMYPADDMTISELKIACYAAQNILDRLESGAMVQRWQISAIVKAKEELASVYTSMSSDDDDEWEDEYDDMEEEEPMYVGFEYPSMYGEETELDEGFKEKIKGIIRREKEKEYPLMQNRRDVAHNKAAAAYAAGDQKKGDRYMKWRSDNMKKEEVEIDEASYRDSGALNMLKASQKADREVAKMRAQAAKRAEKEAAKKKPVEEETDYEVDVEGLPKMYVKADNPSQVKNNLRKVVKNPDMIRGVERVAKATLQKIFRDKATGKDEVAEGVEQLSENPWNQKFQKAPTGDTLPTPERGTVPKHNIKFKEGDQVIVHAGPHAGERHTVTYARTGSVNLLHPSPKNKYDTTTVRAKHEHLTPYKGPVKEEVDLDEGILKSYHSITNKPWSETVKASKNRAGEYKQIAKGKDFTVWTGYTGSLKQQPHYVVKDDKIVGSGMTMNAALKDAKLKDSDLTARSKFPEGSILNKGMKEEVELDEVSDLRITKVYDKKKATYAVHSPDRKYYKEFDTMDAAKAHQAKKTGK